MLFVMWEDLLYTIVIVTAGFALGIIVGTLIITRRRSTSGSLAPCGSIAVGEYTARNIITLLILALHLLTYMHGPTCG